MIERLKSQSKKTDEGERPTYNPDIVRYNFQITVIKRFKKIGNKIENFAS